VFYGSVARGTRPPRRKGTLNSGSIISHEIFRLFILRRSSSDFLLTDSRGIYAVKYRQQYANFSFDITGSYLRYWDCICIRASETRWGTADNERPCYISTWTERIKAARYMYRFCQNGQQLLGYWLRWGTQFSNAFDLIHSGPS
jgi:hypothetical protein